MTLQHYLRAHNPLPSLILGILLGLVSLSSGCTTPSWVTEAEKIAKVALPIVEGIASIVGVSATSALSQVVNDLNLLITLFDKYQATPSTDTLQQIQAGLNTVNADIGQILPAAHIEDAATQNKVAAILELVTSEFSNIASLIPSSAASRSLRPSRAAMPKLPFTAKDFKKQYNKIVKTKTGDPVCDKLFEGKELK
jgi:hypothetical protein